MVKAELAKGIRKDSVLLGIKLGDTQEQFRNKCGELNKQHLTMEAPGFWVRYLAPAPLLKDSPTVNLVFFPEFDKDNKLAGMDMKFDYLGWAPWNRHLQSDSLKIKVKKLLSDWYKGNEFVIAHVGKNEIPVKVDGNRRILIYEEPPQFVIVKVQDILNPLYKQSVGVE